MQYQQTHPNKIKVLEPLILFIVIGAAIIYLINVLNTGNWVWFLQGAAEVNPTRIVILDHGEQTTLIAGHANFILLSDAIRASLSKLDNTDLVSIGLSEQTQADYATQGVVVEVYFNNPVRFNTMARVGEPTQLLIPIDGRHAEGRYVFRGAKGEWWFGAIRMDDPTPLYDALEQMGVITADIRPGGGSS